MKNKLFLSLSLLTAAFTGLNVQADISYVGQTGTGGSSGLFHSFGTAKDSFPLQTPGTSLLSPKDLNYIQDQKNIADGYHAFKVQPLSVWSKFVSSMGRGPVVIGTGLVGGFVAVNVYKNSVNKPEAQPAPVVETSKPTPPGKFEQFKKMISDAGTLTLTAVNENKVATGAAVAAVVGLGLAYKYRNELFGQVVKTEPVVATSVKRTRTVRV